VTIVSMLTAESTQWTASKKARFLKH